MPRLTCLLLVLLPLSLRADELASFTGFTRPGAPNDTRQDGKVLFIADNKDQKKEAIGATVYFTVLDLAKKDDWGVELKELADRFKAGIDANGSPAPAFDAKAKYLYLYQTVNDRGTEVPIQSTLVRIPDDIKASDLTSWGAFRGITLKLAKPAETGKENGPILAVSTSNRDGSTAAEMLYRSFSPALPATQSYRLGVIPTRGDPAPKPGPGVARVEWEQVDPAYQPDHVILAARADVRGLGFRAVWSDKNMLARTGRSTVFGFTSNLPPRYEVVRIQGPRDPSAPVKPAGMGEDAAVTGKDQILAEGQVPVPRPERVTPAAATDPPKPPAPEPPLPPLPAPISIPQPSDSSSSSGGSTPIARGSFGSVGGAQSSGGGGSSGSSGSSSGSSAQAQQTSQQQQQQQAALSPLQQINLIVQQTVSQKTQVSQDQQQSQGQSQSQSQSQSQTQSQGQDQTQGGTPVVVPEPPTIFLGMLALVFLALGYVRSY